MEKEILEKKRKYISDGIANDITIVSKEKERHTFLGSTDRKAYTVRTTLLWLHEQYECYTEIQPFQENAKEILEQVGEKAKYKFSQEIYKKYFLV